MSHWIDICPLEDLQPDSGVCALVEDQQVAIFYMPKDNAVFAVNNYDPFGKVHVLSRGLLGDIKGEPMIASPLYKQHFSLLTGQCFEDESISIPVYAVRIENHRVAVSLEE
ncbi:MAG: nitrite reductase small subunit NirD [Methylococcaceae bacterium]|nr:nitrite reductase small subunit NirD [Methylococcaceae bacterium]